MLDLLIRGADVVDGTGAARQRADVGVRDGLVVAVGTIDESTARVVDVDGAVVAPGIIDIHTHFDAQFLWDPYAAPACLHGVTTVLAGNCGFTIAPMVASEQEFITRMLARVEGMPFEALAAGVDYTWSSFGEYLDRLDGRLGVNAAFLVGHSAIRRVVMGEAGSSDRATPEQIDKMVELLHESLAAGGYGFSTSLNAAHNDHRGVAIPSRHASHDEIVRLAATVRSHPGTTLEFQPFDHSGFPPEIAELTAAMSREGDRPVKWNEINLYPDTIELNRQILAASRLATANGGRVVCRLGLGAGGGEGTRINLRTGYLYDSLPDWGDVMSLGIEAKRAALADTAVRNRLRQGLRSVKPHAFWGRIPPTVIAQTFSDSNEGLAGRTVGGVAIERGADPLDVMFDVSLADDLRTVFSPQPARSSEGIWEAWAEFARDPRTVVGGSDGGAHLDLGGGFSTYSRFIHDAVTERGILSLEEAFHLLTDLPSRLYGIRGRGRVETGGCADLLVIDPDAYRPLPIHPRADLPGGASRFYNEAEGVKHVFVNGAEIVHGNELTGNLPGRLLRSGRDTYTVTAS
jgi:N-acyl-D-aspartate/D-glutamate deacylase